MDDEIQQKSRRVVAMMFIVAAVLSGTAAALHLIQGQTLGAFYLVPSVLFLVLGVFKFRAART